MNLDEGTILNNRYQILRVLSDKGGMGVIYQARDLNFGQTVVIKQLRFTSVEALRQDKQYGKQSEQELREVAESMQQAFEREAKLLFGLRHRALPRVFDRFQTAADDQCLVMEFIEGQDFDDLLRQHGSFPLDRVMDWAEQLLDALHYLHTEFAEPIVHRDINPRNLKLTPKGQVVLLDFGLAKGALPGMSVAGSVWGGSNDYAPIEQIDPAENERQKSDPRSDLYSLAVTLYHLLSGQKPAPAVSRVNAKARGAADLLRPLNELASHVPTPVATVLQHAAAVYAKDRLATAAEMRRLLREAITPAATPRAIAPPKAETETISQPRRGITISLNSEDEKPKPVAEAKLLPQQSFIGRTVNRFFNRNPQRQSLSEELGNGVKLEMVFVPSGSFTMHVSKDVEHHLTVPGFYIGKYPVTAEQWKTLMGDFPREMAYEGKVHSDEKSPVITTYWSKANKFCEKMSERTARNYRLPTEVEWEYACLAGVKGRYCFGNDQELLEEYAWYSKNRPDDWQNDFEWWKQNYRITSLPVGLKKPNAWGIHDMHGNTWEWCKAVFCNDWMKDEYEGRRLDDRRRFVEEVKWTACGGSLHSNADHCSSMSRNSQHIEATIYDTIIVHERLFGFRVVVQDGVA